MFVSGTIECVILSTRADLWVLPKSLLVLFLLKVDTLLKLNRIASHGFPEGKPHRLFRAFYIRQREGWCLRLWCLQSPEVGDLKEPHNVLYLKSSPVWKTSQWPLGIIVFMLAAPWSGNTPVLLWTEFECELPVCFLHETSSSASITVGSSSFFGLFT